MLRAYGFFKGAISKLCIHIYKQLITTYSNSTLVSHLCIFVTALHQQTHGVNSSLWEEINLQS